MVSITHLITELSTGGAQMALYRLLTNLDRSRFDPTVICLYNGDGMIAEQIRALDIQVIDLQMQRKVTITPWLTLYRCLRQQAPAILHTWMFHANIPGRIMGRLARVPIIISSERTMGQENRTRLLLNRITAPWADRIISVSENVQTFAQEVIGLPAHKLIVIPNGLDLTQFQMPLSKAMARQQLGLQSGDQAILIGTVGRPRPVKGYNLLIDAFVQIVQQQSSQELPCHLIIIGDGPEQANLIAQANRLNLSKQITFAPDQSNIPELLSALDIFVSSSHWEGMPNAVLEAMAAGLPVIATAVGGTPEVVLQDETGLLVPPGDPDALANAMIQLLQNSECRATMGEAGRQRVEDHFSIAETVRMTESLYRALCKK